MSPLGLPENDTMPKMQSGTKQINYVKGSIKNLIIYLFGEKQSMDNKTKQHLLEQTMQILELSQRENMNDPIYLFSRRQKAIVCRILIDDLKESGVIKQEEYEKAKTTILDIMLENWSRVLLPGTSGIIPAKYHKTEAYMNYHKGKNKNVLEPREYIGIVPEAYSDLDAPSVVTAMTPGEYEQPWHDHTNNREITFYTGNSIAKYQTNGQEHSIEVNFGEFVILPPKTWHTVYNPNPYPVKNISVKLPSALLDRRKIYMNDKGDGSVKKMKMVGEGIFEATFEDQEVPYFSRLYNFENVKNHNIMAGEKSLLYIVSGEYIVDGIDTKRQIVRESDVILLDKEKTINVESLNKEGSIYMVNLTEGWDEGLIKKSI